MHSGQTRALLMRKARAGEAADTLLRQKRMGDLAWQMNVTAVKLTRFGANNPAADALHRLHAEAKAEYTRLLIETKLDQTVEKYGPLFG